MRSGVRISPGALDGIRSVIMVPNLGDSNMTWIKTLAPDDERVKNVMAQMMPLYPPEYALPVESLKDHNQGAASIVMSHSLIPAAMLHSFSAYGALLSDELPLSRRDHELIAATVSALNDCFY
jgi:hypothetical protein